MRKWFKWILVIMLLSSSLFLIAGGVLYLRLQPKLSGNQTLQGLQGEVTITRDQFGVPHIVASKSDLDAFFALGYVHAQDRFWQMEFDRHVAQGRLSELFGPSTVSKDEYLRTWGFYHAAETAWPALSPQAKQVIEAYTAGVNSYLQQKRYPLQIFLLGYQPKPWTVIDSICWQKMMAWDLQKIWEIKLKNYIALKDYGADQLTSIFPQYPQNAPIVLSDADLKQSGLFNNHGPSSFLSTTAIANNNSAQLIQMTNNVRKATHLNDSPDKGSNAWVVNGKWSQTGKPLLANDPHLDLQAPALWYLAELKGPHLHVIGATIPGMPGVIIGHNDHIAWGVTNVNPDVQDLYVLSPTSKITTQMETINIRGKKSIQYPVEMSDVGPVITQAISANALNAPVAIKWTALMPNDTTMQSVIELNYATDWASFVDALKDFVTPSQNFVYADVNGNIGYYLPGKIPVRNWSSNFPVPDDAQHQWSGFIPFEKLPHIYNPAEGMIVTANNRVVDGDYAYPITFRWDVPPYRAERILQLLSQQKPLTMNKMAHVQLDTVTLLWKSFAPVLLKTPALDASSRYALEQLSHWDGNANLNSVAATIFAYWYRQIANLTPTSIAALSHWPDPLFLQTELTNNGPFCKNASSNNCNDFLSESLQAAMQKLTADLGSDPQKWQWQDVHHAIFTELGFGVSPTYGPMWNRDISSPGFLYSVNVGPYDFGDMQQYNGASYRQIIDLSNLNNSLYIQTLGQSDNPLSLNHQDQMPLWRDGKYLSMSADPKIWGKTQQLILTPK